MGSLKKYVKNNLKETYRIFKEINDALGETEACKETTERVRKLVEPIKNLWNHSLRKSIQNFGIHWNPEEHQLNPYGRDRNV